MNVELTLGIIGIVANVLVAAALAYIGTKVARIEKLEDKLEAASNERIDNRFAAMAGECRLRHGGIDREIAGINERLERGDDHFDELGDEKVKTQLSLAARIEQLKDVIRDNCASRQDVEQLKQQVHQLAGRFDGLQQAMARGFDGPSAVRDHSTSGKGR